MRTVAHIFQAEVDKIAAIKAATQATPVAHGVTGGVKVLNPMMAADTDMVGHD